MGNIKFNNLEEIKKYLNSRTQKALEETLKKMEQQLRDEIFTDVYDAWDAEFYNTKRTYWLVRQGVEHYIKTFYGDRLAGGVRINIHKSFPVDLENYRHGNVYTGKFEPQSFIEMLNNKANEGYAWYNAWHFPVLTRRPFWKEFVKWASENYATIFKEKCEELGIDLEETGNSETETTTKYNDDWGDVFSNNAYSDSYSEDLGVLEQAFGISKW